MVALSKELRISLTITAIVLSVSILAIYLWSCIAPAKKIRVIDVNDTPIADAYVVYFYTGTASRGPAGSDDYHQAPNIAQTNKDGYFTIPSKILLHFPLIKSKAYPEITAIYDPSTHCVGFLPNEKGSDWPKWKYFQERHLWFEIKNANDTTVFVFHDVTTQPVDWYASIKQLEEAIGYYQMEVHGSNWKVPADKMGVLYHYLLRDCEAFKNKYGSQKCGTAENLDILDSFFGREYKESIKDKTFNVLIDKDINLLQRSLMWSDYK